MYNTCAPAATTLSIMWYNRTRACEVVSEAITIALVGNGSTDALTPLCVTRTLEPYTATRMTCTSGLKNKLHKEAGVLQIVVLGMSTRCAILPEIKKANDIEKYNITFERW
jgi:hypothetical protein